MVDFPITVDPTLSDFDYTAETLGLTPVVEEAARLKIPMYTSFTAYFEDPENPGDTIYYDMETLMPEAYMGGDFHEIWIGKDASVDFIVGYTDYTARHEIQSLAFEDGRTSFQNLRVGYIGVSAEYTNAGDSYSTTHYSGVYEKDGKYFDDLEAPRVFATSNEVPDEYYSFDEFIQFCITKELRLPDGNTTFPTFLFSHPAADGLHFIDPDSESTYPSPRLRDRNDISVYIPSSVSSFSILGYYSSDTPATNGLNFGMDIGYPLLYNIAVDATGQGLEAEAIAKAGIDSFPRTEPIRSSYNTDEEFEAAHSKYISDVQAMLDISDHVHIYLQDHTSVPTITFDGSFYFPIVFHVNPEIYDEFVSTYQNSVTGFRESSSFFPGVKPLSFEESVSYGVEETETSTPLSETVFRSVAVTGSFNDLLDKPEIPSIESFNELMSTVATLSARVAELEGQMIVNQGTDQLNFSDIEPENSSDYIVTDYE